MLWVGGVHGDKALGMQQLARAAASEHAHYLRPYARLMLALAALREMNSDVARQQLQELVMEFPENPLFAKELAKVTPVITGIAPPRRGSIGAGAISGARARGANEIRPRFGRRSRAALCR